MKKAARYLWPGLLALVISGGALAHGSGGYDGWSNGGWSGGATVWGDSTGYSAYSGSLGYGAGYGYAPLYQPWVRRPHGPQCRHGPPYGYARGYKHGRRHGYKHGRKHKGWHH